MVPQLSIADVSGFYAVTLLTEITETETHNAARHTGNKPCLIAASDWRVVDQRWFVFDGEKKDAAHFARRLIIWKIC